MQYTTEQRIQSPAPLKDGNIDRQEKKVVIYTFGNEIVEPQPSIIKRTDYDDNGKEVISQSSRIGVTDCEHCQYLLLIFHNKSNPRLCASTAEKKDLRLLPHVSHVIVYLSLLVFVC